MSMYFTLLIIETVLFAVSCLLLLIKDEGIHKCKIVDIFKFIIFSLTLIGGLIINVIDLYDLIKEHFISFIIVTVFHLISAILVIIFREKIFKLKKYIKGLIIIAIVTISAVLFIYFFLNLLMKRSVYIIYE